MTTDSYKEVTNSEETFKDIARLVAKDRAVLIGWTDENMTHFDILFAKPSISTEQIGFTNFQGGINILTDIFVSIMRRGAFAFEIKNEDTYWGYYDEKLGGGLGETTGEKLAELINGVKKYL